MIQIALRIQDGILNLCYLGNEHHPVKIDGESANCVIMIPCVLIKEHSAEKSVAPHLLREHPVGGLWR